MKIVLLYLPHLFNMLIYSPGQFFDLHKDTDKEKNMFASFGIVLPCSHKGGDLIIKHRKTNNMYFLDHETLASLSV